MDERLESERLLLYGASCTDDQDDRMIDRTQPPLTRLATAGNLTGKPIVAYKVKPNVISTCILDTWGKAGNSMRQSCS